MNINKILFVSPMYKELQEIINSRQINKEFRFLSNKQVSKEDYFWADAFVSFRPPQNFEFGNIKWAHSLGAGVDAFLNDRNWNKNIVLTRMTASFGKKMSEYCLSYILSDIQHHNLFKQLKENKLWKPAAPKTLESQKIIIYGTGQIGQEIARYLSLFDVKVSGVSNSGKQKQFFTEVMSVNSATDVLKESDWIINTLPHTKDTYKLFDTNFFKHLSQAGFINVGRGASVDEAALIKALDNNNIRKAILDVFYDEPLPNKSPLWDHKDIIITPHISAVTTPESGIDCFLETLSNIENNLPLNNQVNLDKGY